MWELLQAGGKAMIPIGIAAVLTLAIVLERFWSLRRKEILPPNLPTEVRNWAQHRRLDDEHLKALADTSPLGTVFAALVSLAAFGIGNMVQANSVAASLQASFGIATPTTGIVLAILSAAVILGGIRRIGEVTEILVPFMAIFYLGGGLVILVRFAGELPGAIALVFESAFSGAAATGGFAGATVMMALRYGVARGLFSNEAGLGSAPMVHAAARTDHPVRQGLYGIFEVFVDTMLVCTVTAGAMKVFSADPRIGFLAHARRFGEAAGRGEVLAPARDLAQMQQVVVNDYVNAGLALLFMTVMLITVAFGVRAVLHARRAPGAPSSESPYVALAEGA